MEERQLLVNMIKCPDGTILESRAQHDFQAHVQEDGREYFVDGGLSYQRIGCSDEEYEDLTLYTDSSHELIRERLRWGRNFDKDMNRLPKTEYALVRDITDDHLAALLHFGVCGILHKVLKMKKNIEKVLISSLMLCKIASH